MWREPLSETRQSLKQCEYRLRESQERCHTTGTHWMVRKDEIELTGFELGVVCWATITVAKFRGTQVAVKRIHNQIINL